MASGFHDEVQLAIARMIRWCLLKAPSIQQDLRFVRNLQDDPGAGIRGDGQMVVAPQLVPEPRGVDPSMDGIKGSSGPGQLLERPWCKHERPEGDILRSLPDSDQALEKPTTDGAKAEMIEAHGLPR